MSDSTICVVALSVKAAEAATRAKEVTRWLLDGEVIRANARRDEVRRPSEFVPGLKADKATQHAARLKKLAHNGVDIIVGRSPFDPGENFESVACPKCAAAADVDHYLELIGPWLEGPKEPRLKCAKCRSSHLIGDYEGDFAVRVGELAVQFNNWGELRADFLGELKRQLGPRTRVVYQRV